MKCSSLCLILSWILALAACGPAETQAPAAGAEDALSDSELASDSAPNDVTTSQVDVEAASEPAAGTIEVVAPLLTLTPSPIVFERYGPTPGTTEEQLAEWSADLARLFFSEALDEVERAELLAGLRPIHAVDFTPAVLNTLNGLDMAVAEDIARASALVRYWFLRQAGAANVVLDASRGELSESASRNRILAAESFARWWDRKLRAPQNIESFKRRVDELHAEHERLGIKLGDPDELR